MNTLVNPIMELSRFDDTVMATGPRALFSPLPDGESRARSLGVGFGLEFIVVVLLVLIPMLLPERLNVVTRYWITPIAAPPVVAWKPQPPPPPPAQVKKLIREEPKPKPVIVAEIPKPKIMTPVFNSPIVKPATAKRDTKSPDAPSVKDNIFAEKKALSLGSSAVPTLRKPREAVQTGGFGDPDGVPPNPNAKGTPNIATLGQYDLPPGPGYGNGTGGAKGARGVVASAGFGNGTAAGSPNGGGHGGSGGVQSAGFGDQTAPAPNAQVVKTAAPNPKVEPVEIISKPRPTYTAEAVKNKIEGDVTLQVVFTASGQVEVERVVRGLGYGLDEQAQVAARHIQFKPARRDGQPVDFAGLVHITFELAY
jgi:TonB family protein